MILQKFIFSLVKILHETLAKHKSSDKMSHKRKSLASINYLKLLKWEAQRKPLNQF